MAEDSRKPSQVDATPGSGTTKPEKVEPGTAPRLSEAEAKPDKPGRGAGGARGT